jgi:hypothetical protein
MEIGRTDRRVLGFAILIVGAFITSYAGWGVPLIGSSHRWAAGVIILLGLAAAALSSPGSEARSYALSGLVLAAFLGAVLAFATASTAALALLVVALVALIATSIARHLRHTDRRDPAAT